MAKRTCVFHAAFLLPVVLAAYLGSPHLDAQTVEKEAKLHYKQGVALFKEGKYKMALAEFLRSNELNPNWKLKYNIGVCYYNLNKFLDARSVLLEYLDEGGEELSEGNREKAETLLDKLSKLFVKVRVEANVDGADVTIDGKKVGMTPIKKPVVLEAGLYKVEVKADGYKPYSREISLAGGENRTLDVVLIKEEEPSGEEEGGEGETGEEGEGGVTKGEPGEGGKKPKLGGLAIGAIATGALALGAWGGVAGVGVMVLQKSNELSDCKKEGCPDEEQLVDDGEKLKKVQNFAMIPIAAVLSAASIALGVVAAVKKKKEKEKNARLPTIEGVSLSPAAGASPGWTFSVSGRF